MADSDSRVGSRRMSPVCVPMTRLSSGPTSTFAASMIAWTSGRGATPRIFATRVAVPAQATSPPFTISWATE